MSANPTPNRTSMEGLTLNHEPSSSSPLLPSALIEYNSLQLAVKNARARMDALTPEVIAFVAQLPSRSMDMGDGKVRVMESVTLQPMTKPFVKKQLAELFLKLYQQQNMTAAEADVMGDGFVKAIWQNRKPKTRQILSRTWSVKKRKVDVAYEG